ncbi:hypothetical protein ACFUMH_17185 [Cellulomonas sp. NPDC057328]|uniref:hypothetical protein n=1 Tax=Cellulomonas sp. NPDC057328 TaxID=3346101 RepID=UPI00364298FC
MTLTDDEVATALRARADRDAPTMTLDPVRTIARGRRRRAATAGAAAGAAAVTAVGLVLGTAALLAPPTADAPTATAPDATAPDSDAPVATAAPDVADLAEGLRAARGPVPRTLADGSTWWDTGIGSAATGETLAFGTVDGEPFRTPGDVLAFGVLEATGHLADPMPLRWSPDDALADHGAAEGYHGVTGLSVGAEAHVVDVLVGAVPAWMPGARVAHVLSTGVVDATGAVRHVVEVPTFPEPTGSGASLFVIGGSPRVSNMGSPRSEREIVMEPPSVTVFVGTDGSAYVNGLPVTRDQLALWAPGAPVDQVVADLVALGARL